MLEATTCKSCKSKTDVFVGNLVKKHKTPSLFQEAVYSQRQKCLHLSALCWTALKKINRHKQSNPAGSFANGGICLKQLKRWDEEESYR